MKLDEFISGVLTDIDKGMKEAQQGTSRKYFVESGEKSGVCFDIAVTTVSSEGSSAKGQAKVGFIEVLGAGIGAQLDSKEEQSEISRIKFCVYVPSQTANEEAELMRQLNNRNSGGVGWS